MGDSDFTFDKGILAARELYPGEELIAVEEEYDTPRISHCHIELPVSWAYVDTNGKVTVVCSTQIRTLSGAARPRLWGFRWARSASLNPT